MYNFLPMDVFTLGVKFTLRGRSLLRVEISPFDES
jgi:hypothetical protein